MAYNLRSSRAVNHEEGSVIDSDSDNEEQSTAYIEDSDDEEDSDLVDVDDIENSTELCHQPHHLQPTQVCNQIGRLVATFPTPPPTKDTKNRDSDVITAL